MRAREGADEHHAPPARLTRRGTRLALLEHRAPALGGVRALGARAGRLVDVRVGHLLARRDARAG